MARNYVAYREITQIGILATINDLLVQTPSIIGENNFKNRPCHFYTLASLKV